MSSEYRDRSRLHALAGVVAAATLALAIIYGPQVWQWWHERLDAPPHVTEVDIGAVHRDLFPSWVIAAGDAKASAAEEEAFAALRAAVAVDGNLTALVERLRSAVTGGKLEQDADRVHSLIGQWNAYLDTHGQPFQISGSVVIGTQAMFWATSLETLVEVPVLVGDRTVRTRIMQRVDNTNIRERYLGAVKQGIDGGTILTDRVLGFALDQVWPVLDSTVPDDDLPETARPFAALLRKEASDGLPAAAMQTLTRTAAARLQAVTAVAAIRSRTECSRFAMSDLSWQGPSDRDLQTLHRYVEDDDECPAVTSGEYEALASAAQTLRAEGELRRAIEALLAWATRSVVMHEARHVADAAAYGGPEVKIDCSVCGDRDAAEVRNEVSAYVASIAWAQAPATTLFQACDAVSDLGASGIYDRAVEIVLSASGTACSTPPSVDLASAMQGLELRAFDREEAITLPEGFPLTLPLPPRALRQP